MKKLKLSLCLIVFAFSTYASDILILKNQKSFLGEIIKVQSSELIFKTNGEKFVVPFTDIYSVGFDRTDTDIYSEFLKKSENESNKCLNGRLDAENFHGKNGIHFALGVLFGPFAMVGTALSNPTPEKGKETLLMSKNKDQFSDPSYLSCYKRKAKGQLIGMEAIGWGSWILFLLVF